MSSVHRFSNSLESMCLFCSALFVPFRFAVGDVFVIVFVVIVLVAVLLLLTSLLKSVIAAFGIEVIFSHVYYCLR